MRTFVSSALLIALAACVAPPAGVSSRLERPDLYQEARFLSARFLDASRVVFSWSEGVYRHAEGDSLWSGVRRQYPRHVRVVALYDIDSGVGRILVRDERRDAVPGDGNGNYSVLEARGDVALISRGRETQNGTLVDPGGFFLLDVITDTLGRVDPWAELAEHGLEPRYRPRLVHPSGTLLYQAEAGGAHPREQRVFRFCLRHADGRLEDLGEATYLGESDSRLLLRRHEPLSHEEVDAGTAARRVLPDAELAAALERVREPAAAVSVSADGALLIVEGGRGATHVRGPLAIDVGALGD